MVSVYECVCARSLYVRICPCQCLLLSLPRCEYLFVYICMHGVRQPTIQTSRQQLSTFIPIIFDFMKWKEQWTNGIHTYARTSHTLWAMQNKRANYKNRMRHQLSANGYNSWRREREQHTAQIQAHTLAHTHLFSFIHLFILFDSYCFFVGYQNKMEKKNSKRTRTITKKNENEKGKTKWHNALRLLFSQLKQQSPEWAPNAQTHRSSNSDPTENSICFGLCIHRMKKRLVCGMSYERMDEFVWCMLIADARLLAWCPFHTRTRTLSIDMWSGNYTDLHVALRLKFNITFWQNHFSNSIPFQQHMFAEFTAIRLMPCKSSHFYESFRERTVRRSRIFQTQSTLVLCISATLQPILGTHT